MKLNQKTYKESKGITLVALVITIIILLILAGISIAQLTGNGLFENAKLAKEKSKNAQQKETETLDNYYNKIYEIEGNRDLNNNILKLETTTPSTINVWAKVSDYPDGLDLSNTILKTYSMRMSDICNEFVSTFLMIETRIDGIYMFVSNSSRISKPITLYLEKI